MGPFCQQAFGLGLRLKQGLIGADFMKVRGAAYFGLAAAVALFVHPADTGDLSFFVHTSQKLPWNWFADPSVQVGPLQLLILRVGDLVGALPLVIEVGCAGLIWVVAGRLVGRRAQLFVSLAAVALGLTYSAYMDGHPAQLVAPLLWVLAALEVRRGRGVRAGALVGLSAGFELWGLLGVAVLVLAPRVRAAAAGFATQLSVVLAMFMPFVIAGHFRMFDYHWQVNGDTVLGLFVNPGTPFTWPMRVLQGLAAVGAGAVLTWPLRRSLHAVWVGPLGVVTTRLVLDPVRYPWYWLALETLALLGVAEFLTSELFTVLRRRPSYSSRG